MPGLLGDILQQRQGRVSAAAQQARRSGGVLLTPESIEVEDAVQAGIPGAGRGVRTGNDSLEEEHASDRGQDSRKVEEELAHHLGQHPPASLNSASVAVVGGILRSREGVAKER